MTEGDENSAAEKESLDENVDHKPRRLLVRRDTSSFAIRSFEDILHIIKPMGPWQYWIYFWVWLYTVYTGFMNYGIAFLQITPPFWCSDADVNGTSMGTNSSLFSDACTKANGDACETWTYAQTSMHSTIVTEWDLVCDKALLSQHAQLVYMCGATVGMFSAGRFSDRWGRKTVLVVASTAAAVFSMIMTYSPSYAMFMVFRFLLGLSTSTVWTPAFVLGLEITSARWRSYIGGAFWAPYSCGAALLALVAYGIRDWRTTHMVVTLPMFSGIVYWWLIPESPRWLLVEGKVEQAEKVIRQAARMNGVVLPEDIDFATIAKNISDDAHRADAKQVGTLTLFKYPVLLGRSLICVYAWFACSLCYFGMLLFVGIMPTSVFLTNGMLALVEALSDVVAACLLSVVPRKRLFFYSALIAGVCLLVLPWLPQDRVGWLVIVFALVGKGGLMGAWAVVYVYTTEIFPTVMRNTCLSNASFGATVGAIIAPYIAAIPKVAPHLHWLPPIILGASILPAAFLMLLPPETMGKKLPDHLDDVINTRSRMHNSRLLTEDIDYDD